MIAKNESKTIKKVLGKFPLQTIYNYLVEQRIVKDGGAPYSKSHISNVLNEAVSHEILEDGILKCAKHYKRIAKEKASKKDELLNSLKK